MQITPVWAIFKLVTSLTRQWLNLLLVYYNYRYKPVTS